jgi:hypothetical protein
MPSNLSTSCFIGRSKSRDFGLTLKTLEGNWIWVVKTTSVKPEMEIEVLNSLRERQFPALGLGELIPQ